MDTPAQAAPTGPPPAAPTGSSTAEPMGSATVATDAPTAAPTGPPDPAPARPQSTHGRGNAHSLILSMLVMAVVVFVVYALIPRPAQRMRAEYNAASKAQQVTSETSWKVATADAGSDWRATSASYEPGPEKLPVWTVGYHQRPEDAVYVVLTQSAVPANPASDQTPAALEAWVTRVTRGGADDGTVVVAGRTWLKKQVVVGESTYRSLVLPAPGWQGLTTVLTGATSYDDLQRFAAGLR